MLYAVSRVVSRDPAGPLVPFGQHTAPPMSPSLAVPELSYPTPVIPMAGIQLAYTPGWRNTNKLAQANSEGMFPRTSWPGSVNFKATVVEATERGAPYSVSLPTVAAYLPCMC